MKSLAVTVIGFLTVMALPLTIHAGLRCDFDDDGDVDGDDLFYFAEHYGSVDNTCRQNDSCTPGEFCQKAEGDCGGEGACTNMPLGCPPVWDPVCGCDGITYGNACDAAMGGVNVAYRGECLGEACTENVDCPSGTYCSKSPGDCDGRGSCEEIPAGCFDIWDPVCGCDGNTYPNACYAALAGVNTSYQGVCVQPACNLIGDCAAGNYCRKVPGDCEGSGECTGVPAYCPMYYIPVCGCDGTTYINDCVAAANSVNVKYSGVCN
jgi:hypothetical protein